MVNSLGEDGLADALRFVHFIEATDWYEVPSYQAERTASSPNFSPVAMFVRATCYRLARRWSLLLAMSKLRAVDVPGMPRCFILF